MSQDRRGIARRRVLAAGLTGGAAVAMSPSKVLASHRTASVDGTGAIGAVSRPSGEGSTLVSVDIGGQVREVSPVDFPADWRFLIGDLLYVDLDHGEARPYVRNEASSGRVRLIARNEDPDLEREFGLINPDDMQLEG